MFRKKFIDYKSSNSSNSKSRPIYIGAIKKMVCQVNYKYMYIERRIDDKIRYLPTKYYVFAPRKNDTLKNNYQSCDAKAMGHKPWLYNYCTPLRLSKHFTSSIQDQNENCLQFWTANCSAQKIDIHRFKQEN